MYNEKVLNSVQTGLPGFSAMYRYTTNVMRHRHTTLHENLFSEDSVWHHRG